MDARPSFVNQDYGAPHIKDNNAILNCLEHGFQMRRIATGRNRLGRTPFRSFLTVVEKAEEDAGHQERQSRTELTNGTLKLDSALRRQEEIRYEQRGDDCGKDPQPPAANPGAQEHSRTEEKPRIWPNERPHHPLHEERKNYRSQGQDHVAQAKL